MPADLPAAVRATKAPLFDAFTTITLKAAQWHAASSEVDEIHTQLMHTLAQGKFPSHDLEKRAHALLQEPQTSDGGARRRNGIHYTPPSLVATMCRRALAIALEEKMRRNGANPERASQAAAALSTGSSPDLDATESETCLAALLDFRICDPAAGAGAFLVGMLETMTDLAARLSTRATPRSRFDLMRHIAGNCLYGAEIQPLPTRIARLRLHLALCAQMQQEKLLPNANPLPDLDTHIVRGDSLLGTWQDPFPAPPDQPPLPPFPQVFKHDGFDIVVGNPPYIGFGMRGRSESNADWTKEIRRLYPRSAEYKISTYALFFELALRWLRPGGALCYVTPDSFLTGRYFSKLRNLLLEESALREIALFQTDFWRRGVVGRPVVTLAVRAAPPGPIRNTLATDPNAFAAGRVLSHTLLHDTIATGERRRFRLLFSPEDERFVATMEQGARPLSDFLRIATGIRSRTRQNDIVSSETQMAPPWRPGLISGNQVVPFRTEWRGHFLRIDPDRLYSGGFDPDIVENPKILIRQTGDSLIAALDTEGLYHLNNIHNASPRQPDVPLRYLCILLNSRAMNHYYHLISHERGRAMAQTRIDVLGELPVRIPPPEALQQLDAIWGTLCKTETGEEIEQIVTHTYELPTP